MTPNLDFFVYQNRFSFFFLISTTEISTTTFFFQPFFSLLCHLKDWRSQWIYTFFGLFLRILCFFKDIMYDQLHNPHNIAKLHWYFQSVYSCIQYFTMWTFLQWEKKIGASSSPYISVPLVMMLETTPVHPLHCECACDSQKTLKSTQ